MRREDVESGEYLEDFYEAYRECALWSSQHVEEDGTETPFDDVDAEMSEVCEQKMQADCRDFIGDNVAALAKCGLTAGHAGHDFWLTRNGHGSGFWDEGHHGFIANIALDLLTKASKPYGSSDLYLGDDGEIHVQ